MRGYERFNFPLFDEAADYCRSVGWEVVSPAEHDRELYAATGKDIEQDPGYLVGDPSMYADGQFSFKDCIMWDLAAIAECDGIVLLPLWQESTGAKLEKALADALGLKTYRYYPAVDAALEPPLAEAGV